MPFPESALRSIREELFRSRLDIAGKGGRGWNNEFDSLMLGPQIFEFINLRFSGFSWDSLTSSFRDFARP